VQFPDEPRSDDEAVTRGVYSRGGATKPQPKLNDCGKKGAFETGSIRNKEEQRWDCAVRTETRTGRCRTGM